MMALPSLWVASGEAPAQERFANVHYRRAFLLLRRKSELSWTRVIKNRRNNQMRLYRIMSLLSGAIVMAAQASDRVYTADQTSNTVSVIDPATNKLLGSIHLGEDVPAALSPLYRGELLVHGLGFSPDHKTLDVR